MSSIALRDSDASAVPRPSDNEQVRLREMVRLHFDFIWRSIRRYGVHEADVDDLVQRAFLTAARRMAEIRFGAERAFLFAVAMREAGHVRRSYKRRGEVSEEAIADRSTGSLRPDELAGRNEALAFIGGVLDDMPDELRVVFVLFEVEELSSAEIAALLEIPVGTAKSRLRRARLEFEARTASLRESVALP